MSQDRLLHRVVAADLGGTCLEGCLSTCIAVEDRWAATCLAAPPAAPCLRLLVTHRGRATLHHSGGVLTLPPRSLALLAGGWAYRERRNSAGWHMHALLLAGPWLRDVVAGVRAVGGAQVLTEAPDAWRAEATAIAEAVLGEDDRWPWEVASRLARLLPELVAEAGHDWAARLRRALHAHPARPWPVAALARVLGLGVSDFAHRAPAVLGCSPARWVRRERIALARTWLATEPVQAVAARLGFATPFHFSRVFRAETGQPPSAWRRHLAGLTP